MFFVGQWQKWKQKPSVLRHSLESLWAMHFNFLGKTDSQSEAFISYPFV